MYYYIFMFLMSPSQHNSPVGPRDTPSKEQVHVPTTLIDLESHKEPWGWNERIAPTMWLLHMTNHVKGSSRSSSHLMVMSRVFFQEQFPPHGHAKGVLPGAVPTSWSCQGCSSRSSSHLMVMSRVFFQEQFPPHGHAKGVLPGAVPTSWLREHICPNCSSLVADYHSVSHSRKCPSVVASCSETQLTCHEATFL